MTNTDLAALSAAAKLWPGLDHIANFINTLDSEGMTAKDVRTAIYTECLSPKHRTGDLVLINREGLRERVAEAISVERQNWGGSGTVVTYDRDLADAAVTAILGEQP